LYKTTQAYYEENKLKEKKILEINSMDLMPFTYFVIIHNIIFKKTVLHIFML